MPAENIECNRWSYTDLDEKCRQKFDVWHFVPASGTYRSRQINELCYSGVPNTLGLEKWGGIGEIEALCISMSYCSTLFCTLERNLNKNMKKNVGLVNLKRNSISHIESSKIRLGDWERFQKLTIGDDCLVLKGVRTGPRGLKFGIGANFQIHSGYIAQ